MLFFPIVWREISEKTLHVIFLLLLRPLKSSSVCGFFPSVVSLVSISILHEYHRITFLHSIEMSFYVMMLLLFLILACGALACSSYINSFFHLIIKNVKNLLNTLVLTHGKYVLGEVFQYGRQMHNKIQGPDQIKRNFQAESAIKHWNRHPRGDDNSVFKMRWNMFQILALILFLRMFATWGIEDQTGLSHQSLLVSKSSHI